METTSTLLDLCEENPLFTDGFPQQRLVTRSLNDVFFDAPEQTVERTIDTPVILDATALITTSL